MGVLWERWGSPPSVDGTYTSGFEEEFELALQRHKDLGQPFIRLYFKDIDEKKILDPGSQLSKVLEFRRDIQNKKEILYETFQVSDEFAKKVRLSIADYINHLKTLDRRDEQATNSQPPSAETGENKTNEEDINTRTAKKHAIFLREFVNNVENGELYDLPPPSLARARNILCVAGRRENDEEFIGPHDANLIYTTYSPDVFAALEIFGLAGSGLFHFESQNSPLWTWFNICLEESPEWIFWRTMKGPELLSRQLFQVLGLLQIEVANKFLDNDRNYLVDYWLGLDRPIPYRTAALGYLGEMGSEEDLPHIQSAISSSDAALLNAAVSAYAKIVAKKSISDAVVFVICTSFDTLSDDCIPIFERGIRLVEYDEVEKGLSHRSEQVRLECLKEIRRRDRTKSLDLSTLKKDSSWQVRSLVLEIIEHISGPQNEEEAKSILVQRNTKGAFGIFSRGLANGQHEFDAFRRKMLLKMNVSELKDRMEQRPFEAIECEIVLFGKNSNSTNFGRLRSEFDGRFEQTFDQVSSRLAQSAGSGISASVSSLLSISKADQTKVWMQLAGHVLAGQRLEDDFARIRDALAEGTLEATIELVDYFERFASFNDIPILGKMYVNGRQTSLLGIPVVRPEVKKAIVQAALNLSKNRLAETLLSDLPTNMKNEIIIRSSLSVFKKIGADTVFELLKNTDESIRRVVAIKCCLVFTKRDNLNTLKRYSSLDSRYYNVIFWLDLVNAFPVARAREIAARALKD